MVSKRLAKQDWLDRALHSLTEEGYGSLRAERLAASLGVSRGSFYWHFADVAEFEAAVLAHWETVAVDQPYTVAMAGAGADRTKALHTLLRTVFDAPVDLERAIRSWATISATARVAVGRVDARRVDLLAGILSSNEDVAKKVYASAVTLYWSYLGHVMTGNIIQPAEAVAELFLRFGPPQDGSNRP